MKKFNIFNVVVIAVYIALLVVEGITGNQTVAEITNIMAYGMILFIAFILVKATKEILTILRT